MPDFRLVVTLWTFDAELRGKVLVLANAAERNKDEKGKREERDGARETVEKFQKVRGGSQFGN